MIDSIRFDWLMQSERKASAAQQSTALSGIKDTQKASTPPRTRKISHEPNKTISVAGAAVLSRSEEAVARSLCPSAHSGSQRSISLAMASTHPRIFWQRIFQKANKLRSEAESESRVESSRVSRVESSESERTAWARVPSKTDSRHRLEGGRGPSSNKRV